MRKTKKLLLFIILFFTVSLCIGCNVEPNPNEKDDNTPEEKDNTAEEKLEKAMEALQKANYTIEGVVSTEVEIVANGQNQKQKIEYEMLTQCDGNETYSEISMNGEKICTYVTIDGDIVKTYTNVNGTWIQGDDISLSEYKNENNEMIDIEVEDCFEFKDNKWIGDAAKISGQLKEYMEEAFEEYTEYGMEIVNIIVNQYDITIDEEHISNIDTKMTMTMSSTYGVMRITITMPMKYSKIGETKIIKPEI